MELVVFMLEFKLERGVAVEVVELLTASLRLVWGWKHDGFGEFTVLFVANVYFWFLVGDGSGLTYVYSLFRTWDVIFIVNILRIGRWLPLA